MSVSETRCWFHINQHIREKGFEHIEQEAASIFLNFMKSINRREEIVVYWFDIYVEQNVDYDHQRDQISSGFVRLSAHIDKPIFDRADDRHKLRLILSASLVLLDYLAEKLPLPKSFDAERLTSEYRQYLEVHSLLLKDDEVEKTVVKPFETTRFDFIQTSTTEVDEARIHFDLNELQSRINNALANKTFGTSVRRIEFGFELFDFGGQFAAFQKQNEGLMKYRMKFKSLLVVKQFDYSSIKAMNPKLQFELLRGKIMEGLNEFESMSKKPKDFDRIGLSKSIENVLNNYHY